MKFKYRDLQPLPKEGAWSDLLHSILTQTKVDYSMRPSTFAVRILSYFILLQTRGRCILEQLSKPRFFTGLFYAVTQQGRKGRVLQIP